MSLSYEYLNMSMMASARLGYNVTQQGQIFSSASSSPQGAIKCVRVCAPGACVGPPCAFPIPLHCDSCAATAAAVCLVYGVLPFTSPCLHAQSVVKW
jgi:hypothetical protein